MLSALLLIACALEAPTPPAASAPPTAKAGAAAEPSPAAEDDPPPAGKISGEPILERPIVLGSVDTPTVERVVGAARADIETCFTAERQKSPELAGKVLVRFSIGTDGAVSSVRTKTTSLRHPPTEDCLNARVGELRFPPAAGGGTAIVTYPFTFGG